jgi:hypothetical protein
MSSITTWCQANSMAVFAGACRTWPLMFFDLLPFYSQMYQTCTETPNCPTSPAPSSPMSGCPLVPSSGTLCGGSVTYSAQPFGCTGGHYCAWGVALWPLTLAQQTYDQQSGNTFCAYCGWFLIIIIHILCVFFSDTSNGCGMWMDMPGPVPVQHLQCQLHGGQLVYGDVSNLYRRGRRPSDRMQWWV